MTENQNNTSTIEVRFLLGDIMEKRGLTQLDIENKTNKVVRQGTVSRMLKPDRLRYEIVHLILIARALEISLEDMFEIKDQDGNIISLGSYLSLK